MDIQDASSTLMKSSHKTAEQELQQAQKEVDEIVGIMRFNVLRVMERDYKLDDLNKRADALHEAATQFKLQSHKLKRKHRWANVKMKITLGVISAIVVIVISAIACWVFVSFLPREDSSTESPTHAPDGNS